MQLSLKSGKLAEQSADTIIVYHFAGTTLLGDSAEIDGALNGAITELIENGDLTGASNEVRIIYTRGAIPANRVIVVGLGEAESVDLLALRNAAAHAILAAKKHKANQIASAIPGLGLEQIGAEAAAQAAAEGSLLALQQFDAQKLRKKAEHEIGSLDFYAEGEDSAEIEAGLDSAEKICAGVKLTRDLTFLPPNVANPSYIADTAQEIADQFGLAITIGDRVWMREHKMGSLLAVAQGAGFEPRFVVLEYNADKQLPTIVLVGKGITFDTGGINLKSSANMATMKCDMGGCATVLGTIKAVAALNLPLHVVAITPCTENMPDANAYRPSDVITASNGITIEIDNTDAEGRLAMADALVYAQRYSPDFVVDFATLTGVAVSAMGEGVAAALFCNESDRQAQLMAAGVATHERVWPFPLWDDYRKVIESPVADIKNSGGKGSGLGSSAVFLENFVDYNWAHIDIAGMALTNQAKAQTYEKEHGALGFGVRLMVEFLRNYS